MQALQRGCPPQYQLATHSQASRTQGVLEGDSGGSPGGGQWFLGLFAPKPSSQCQVPHRGSTLGCTNVQPDSSSAPPMVNTTAQMPSSEHTHSSGPEWIHQALPSD